MKRFQIKVGRWSFVMIPLIQSILVELASCEGYEIDVVWTTTWRW